MDMTTGSPTSTTRLPGWLAEALDVLSARRRVVVATAVGIVLLGGIVAVVAPSILPPRAVVGAAVGIAAALLATAVALAMDASDLVVRGARHVRAAGGSVDVRVGRQHDDVGPLLAAVARHAADGRVRVALAPASRSAGVPGVRAAALAEALARTGRKVLLTDLTRGGTPAAGLSDVIAGSRTLPEVVRFEQELYLARLAVGSDPDAALAGFAGWVEALPSDLEVLVVALPPLAEKGVLPATGALDVTLVLVEVDRTERVDLIASLDAVDASGVASELVLVDPSRTPAAAPATSAVAEGRTDAVDHEAGDEIGEADDTLAPDVLANLAAEAPATEEPTPAADPLPEEDVAEDVEGTGTGPFEDGTDDDLGLPPATPPYEYEVADAPADEPEPAPVGEAIEPESEPEDEMAAVLQRDDEVAAPDAPEEADEADEADEAHDDPHVTAEIAPFLDTDGDLAHIWGDAPSSTTAPGPVAPVAPEPEPEPTASEPEPLDHGPEPEPEPQPQPVAAGARPVSDAPDGPELDPAALEVARTSAALHQLAQQIWDRDDA